jgi:ABC-type transporter Mla MlaB component
VSSDSRDKKARKGAKALDSTQELPLGWPTAQLQRTQMGVDSHLNIEVVSASSELAAAVEEAAIFYANAQSAEAKDSLSHAVQKENLAPAAERLWLMLLDLHRQLGERAEFEARAHEYAKRFECERPQFELEEVAAAPDALRAPHEVVSNAKAFLGVIEEASASRTRVQVDCTELQRVDFVSAAALLNIAARLNRDGKRLELENVNELVAALFEVMGVAALAKVTTRH